MALGRGGETTAPWGGRGGERACVRVCAVTPAAICTHVCTPVRGAACPAHTRVHSAEACLPRGHVTGAPRAAPCRRACPGAAVGRKAVPWGSRGVQGSPAQGAEESRHGRLRPPFVLRLRRRGCGSALQGHALPQPLREGRDPPGHEGPFAPHPPAPEQFNAGSRRPRHARTCPHTRRQNPALGMQHPRPHGKEGLGALQAAPGQSGARSCLMAENQGIDLNHAGLCWGAGPHGGTLGPGGDRQTDGQGGIYLSPREGPLPAALKWVWETARLPPSPE